MPESRYMTGYNGTVRTKAELLAWSHWQNLDAEYQRRALAIIDASLTAGRPLGIGSIFRSFAQQQSLFFARHHEVKLGGCCSYNGKRYALNKGMAHAAPPGRSYHEATTKHGKALAIDFTGDLAFLAENAAKYGLKQFGSVNGEPWHGQPADIPDARSRYVLATMDPLKSPLLPGDPLKAPVRVFAPTPTLKVRGRLDGKNAEGETRKLQLACNFWGWRDAMGRTLIVDDGFGDRTAQGVCSMQRTLGATVDGVYGPATARAFQRHLDAMSAIASKGA